MTTEASAVSEADTESKQKASAAEPEPENEQNPEAAASEPEAEPSNKEVPAQPTKPTTVDASTSPDEDLRPRTRTSAGKGLSRLFSNFLKRRSQCSEGEGFEVEKAKEEKADKEDVGEKSEEEKEETGEKEDNKEKPEEAQPEEKEKTEEPVEKKEEKKKTGERVEKKGSKKKKKDAKKKAEEKDSEKSKEEKKEEVKKEETEKAEVEEKGEEGSEKKEEEKKTSEEKDKGEGAAEKESKEEEKVDKKLVKKKEKDEKVKKKEEEKAKKKAEEEEKIKKKEEEKERKKEEEKAREAEKLKKKEEEKTKKKEEEEKAKEEKKKKEEDKLKEAKRKEEEKLKETKKKEEEKSKEAKKKEEEKTKEAKKKEEEKETETKKKEEKASEGKKKEEKGTESKKDEKVTESKKGGEEKKKEPEKTEEKQKGGKKKDKGKKGKKEDKQSKGSTEEQVKAPIAAPEPELKTEPEADQVPDQQSTSSADAHAAPEEQKEVAEKKDSDAIEEIKEEESEKKEDESEEQGEEAETKDSSEEKAKKPAKDKKVEDKGSKKLKTMQCKVTLLDDAVFECELDKHAKAQELFIRVCDHLNLLEKDYFSLAHWENPTTKTWLDPTKEIRKQVPGAVYDLTFNMKFYPPDPSQLTEDLTRYYLCLQLRKDIMLGVLPCSFVTLSLLGSYTAQSELGEYDPEVHGPDYVKELSLAPGQSKELEDKVMELHRTYRSMSPAQADQLFLENAKKLAMYGVDLHQAKDLDGVDITLGVCSSGLMVYKDKLRINRFPWPKVLKISYKRSSFFIKIRPSEQEQYESTIGFKLPNYKASKKLWKVCVEHHTFFRVSTTEPPSSRRFIVLGSKFRYSGRTQAQTRQASSMIDRPAPRFTRSASKRLSRNLDGVAVTQRGTRPVSAPVFSQAALIEAGIPMAPFDQPQTSTPIKTVIKEEQTLEETGEGVESTKTRVKEFDKPQEDLLRHHASISELKRNFMESVPQSKPSEWDKRLSTHSPFRTLGVNGQPLPSSDGSLSVRSIPGSETKAFYEEPICSLDDTAPTPEVHMPPVAEQSCDLEAVSETVSVVNAAPPTSDPADKSLDDEQEAGSGPGLPESSERIVGSASYFTSQGPQVVRCFQPPLVETQTVTITAVSNSSSSVISTTEVPIVSTQAVTYESSKVKSEGSEDDKDCMTVSSSVTSETTSGTSVTTTTHISKVVRSGSSETRVEKRIVITGDSDMDQEKEKESGASAL